MEFNQTNNNQGDVNNRWEGLEINIGHPNVSSTPLKSITLWLDDKDKGPMAYRGLLDFLILVYPENGNMVYRTVGTDTPEKQMALAVLLGDTVAAKMLADKLTNGE